MINKLPETTVTAAEFIKLLDAALFAESDEAAAIAMKAFKARMAEIAKNQAEAMGKHSQN